MRHCAEVSGDISFGCIHCFAEVFYIDEAFDGSTSLFVVFFDEVYLVAPEEVDRYEGGIVGRENELAALCSVDGIEYEMCYPCVHADIELVE